MEVKPVGNKSIRMEKRKASSAKGEGETEFRELLEKGAHPAHVERIKKLFDDIESAADNLAETPGEVSLKEYRKRIRAFIKEVLKESREVKVIPRPGIYEDPLVVVKIIDEKLDELARLVLSEEVERGEMARIIDEIKGIIIDLYR